jgi:hypothetical protein
VVEHLQAAELLRFLRLAYDKLRPGAPIVLETINAACWAAFFDAYIRDITHARPLHPGTLEYYVRACGFSAVDVQFRERRRHDRWRTSRRPPPAIRPCPSRAVVNAAPTNNAGCCPTALRRRKAMGAQRRGGPFRAAGAS